MTGTACAHADGARVRGRERSDGSRERHAMSCPPFTSMT